MERITSQSSLSAIHLYQSVQKDKTLDIKNTRTGDIRVATIFDRFINTIADFIKADSPNQRREQARQAIREKFITEAQTLGQAPTTAQTALFENAIDNISEGQDTAQLMEKIGNDKFQTTMRHIRTIASVEKNSNLKLIWKAISEDTRRGSKAPDTGFAIAVANNAMAWKDRLNISENKAYRLAYNAEKLKQKQGIPTETGMQILQLSGRLVNGYGMESNEALQYAIDLWEPLQKTGMPFSALEKIIDFLDHQIPELEKFSEKTRISATLCYLQLQDASYVDPYTSENFNPLAEIKARLADLPHLQQALPKGCIAEQIHDGAHIRGRNILTSEHDSNILKKLNSQANSLSSYPLFDGHGAHVALPEAYQSFEKQFVKDVTRGYKFELSHSGKTDTDFESSEIMRRKNPKNPDQLEKQSWAEKFIAYFGSTKTASTATRLLSQTILGEAEISTAENFRNSSGRAVMASGEDGMSPMNYAIDENEANGKRYFTMHQTRLINATRLVASQHNPDSSEDILPLADLEIDLIPNAGMNQAGHDRACTLKREFIFEVDTDALEAGSTSILAKEISDTWDIIIDQKARMEKRKKIISL